MIKLLILNFLCYLKEKPQVGAGSTAGSFFTGLAIHFTLDGVLKWLQLLAFLVTIVVGISTIYTQHVKRKELKKLNKK